MFDGFEVKEQIFFITAPNMHAIAKHLVSIVINKALIYIKSYHA